MSTTNSLHVSHLRKWIFQSPPVEWAIGNVRELLLAAIRQGAVPQHIAFVMDGNRRFARDHQIETIEGHNLGFEALAHVCIPRACIQTRISDNWIDTRSVLQDWCQGSHHLCLQH